MASSSETKQSTSRHGGLFFVAGMLVLACGVIGYLAVDRSLRSDRPAPAAFTPAAPPKAPQ